MFWWSLFTVECVFKSLVRDAEGHESITLRPTFSNSQLLALHLSFSTGRDQVVALDLEGGFAWGVGEEACVTTLGRASCLRCAVCPTWVCDNREEECLPAVPKSPTSGVSHWVLAWVQLTRLLSSDILVCRERLRIGWTCRSELMGSSPASPSSLGGEGSWKGAPHLH